MKKILKLIATIIWLLIKLPIKYLYLKANKQNYFVSGTGVHTESKERKWFRTVLHTQRGILPILAMEQHCKKQFGFDTCIVINFQKISKSQAKTFNQEFDLNYTDDKLDNTENEQKTI